MANPSTTSRAESSHESTSVRDRSSNTASDSQAAANRMREELSSIFGKTQSPDSNRPNKAESDTSKEAGDRPSGRADDKTFRDFAKTNGLDTRNTPDGKLEFSLRSNGEKVTIGSVDKTHEGLREINKTLKEITDKKQAELENKYGVKFAKPGDSMPRQQVDSNSNSSNNSASNEAASHHGHNHDRQNNTGKELAVRDPKLRELLGVEAALAKANPSHATTDNSKKLNFYFLKDQSFSPNAGGAAAFEPNMHGNPAVIVDPNSTDQSPITERDRDDKTTSDHRSIESLMIHELGHHSEEKVFKNEAEKSEFYKGMGWKPIPGTKPEDNQWMINGKDGRGYAPGGIDPNSSWQRIDQTGKVTGSVSADRVERLAQVKPATSYFEGPHEMLAEGLTMLRLGNGHRSHLMQRDNKLYGLIKGLDQKEIDMTHGVGKYMRSYEGTLLPRSAEAERALQLRELAVRTRR